MKDDFEESQIKAEKLFGDKKFDKALKVFLKLHKINPYEITINLHIAVCYYELERFNDSIRYYKNVLNSPAIDLEILFITLNGIGGAYYQINEFENALIYYLKAEEIKQKEIGLLRNIGDAYLRLRKFDLAISYYTKAIDIDDSDELLFLHRAYSLFYKNKGDEALIDLEQATKLNKKNKTSLYLIGTIYNNKKDYYKSANYFFEADKKVLTVISQIKNIEVAEFMLDLEMKKSGKPSFFKKTLNKGGINDISSEIYKTYRSIYIKSLRIISLLHINNKYENKIAHYTHKKTLEQLIFSESPFRLNTILTTNDPKEGQVLNEFFGISIAHNEVVTSIENDFKAFISSFSFNHDSLNQFRLYGKENDKEGTGVSIVFNGDFFNREITDSTNLDVISDNNDFNDSKKALFRCLYIDPVTKELVSIGQREIYTFYYEPALKTKLTEDVSQYGSLLDQAITGYASYINDLFQLIKDYLIDLNKLISENSHLDNHIISELLLMLRYLTKHVAFKEEQECRMLSIDSIMNNPKILPKKGASDFSKLYIEYYKVFDYIEKVFFAPKTEGFELFQIHLKRFGLKIECLKSSHPLS